MSWCGLALLLALGSVARADAQETEARDLCGRLTIPPMLEIDCALEQAADAERAVVAPTGGTFAALSRMTLRQLDPEADALAWSGPSMWLERQMILDLDGVEAALEALVEDPDSPFGSDVFASAIGALVGGLDDLSRLPLAACGAGASEREVTCRFGAEPLSLIMKVMLIEDGEARYAVNMRSFNEQRLRHFTAVANSFERG